MFFVIILLFIFKTEVENDSKCKRLCYGQKTKVPNGNKYYKLYEFMKQNTATELLFYNFHNIRSGYSEDSLTLVEK